MGSITTEVVETGEKRDTRGRRVATEERRAKMVQAYQGTGLTMAEFARRKGIKDATFAGWVAKASRLVLAKSAIKFAEVRVQFQSAPTGPSAQLRCDWQMERRSAEAGGGSDGVAELKDMLAFPAAIRIYVAVQPVDMRKSFNGLWSAASEQLGPKNGAVFAFIKRERTRLKLLDWDGTVGWVFAKRLEQGRFSGPAAINGRSEISLAPEALALLIGGVESKHGSLPLKKRRHSAEWI